jgi:hypothetical protein
MKKTYGHNISRFHAPSLYTTHRGFGLGSLFSKAFSSFSRSTRFRNAFGKTKTFFKTKALPASKKIIKEVVKQSTPVLKELSKQAINQAVEVAGEKVGELITKAGEKAKEKGVPESIVQAVEDSAQNTKTKVLDKGKRKLIDTVDQVASKKAFSSRLEAAK